MPNMFNILKNPKQGLLGKPTVSQTPKAEDTQKRYVPNNPVDKAYLYGQRKAQEQYDRDHREYQADPTKISVRGSVGQHQKPNFHYANEKEIARRLSPEYPIEQLERKKRIEQAKRYEGSLGKASGGAAKAMKKSSKISTAEKNPKHKNCW